MFPNYFHYGPIPMDVMYGTYDWRLVLLSYLMAVVASYVALDMAARLRDETNTPIARFCWLFGGAFAMGAGIWSMHFIGMLAFQMPMIMTFAPSWTILSIIVAVLSSLIALTLLMRHDFRWPQLMIGGLFLGLGIAAMHYTGMYAMTDTMVMRFLPSYYTLSIIIAIFAAEAALWLAIKSNQRRVRSRVRLKVISALVMGAAICGMHYTGMAAALFFPKAHPITQGLSSLDPNMLSISIAVITFLILGIAFALSTYHEITNQQLITTARLTGMAEVSSNVLHSVGNVLNSLNVSVNLIGEHVENAKISQLQELSKLINQHKSDLPHFFTNDPRAIKIPEYVEALAAYWEDERKKISTEIQSVLSNIQHIKSIISTQQSMKNVAMLEEMAQVHSITDEAITITGIAVATHLIRVIKEYNPVKPFLVDKVKLLQILVNLLRNAKDALIASNNAEKIVLIKLGYLNPNTVAIQIIDNGVGIKPEDLKQIFTHGFTTKESGHGFGLHSSAILIRQMNGSLTVESAGENLGSTFTVLLPIR